jgi:Flp pilus assembly protein CpaB
VLLGLVAAGLAAILLIVYLRSYRSSVNSGTRPMTVLVAKSLIPKGTSGKFIAEQGLYQVTTVPRSQLKTLAMSDPASLNGVIAADDINPGQQFTQSDFIPEASGGLSSQLTGSERAIAVTVDSEHGLTGEVRSGDHVDVYVGNGDLLKLLAANILVLSPPGSGSNGNAILQVTSIQAPQFALASDNTKIWLVLRPVVGARKTPPASVTLPELLASTARAG